MVVGFTSTHIIRKDIAKKKTEKINCMSAIPTGVRRMKFSICMLEFLINNIFMEFGGNIFPVGTIYALLLVDLLLYSFHNELMQKTYHTQNTIQIQSHIQVHTLMMVCQPILQIVLIGFH